MDDESIPTPEIPMPPAWVAALERFAVGYGCRFDPADDQDRYAFLMILEDVVRERITHELAEAIREATARLRADFEGDA